MNCMHTNDIHTFEAGKAKRARNAKEEIKKTQHRQNMPMKYILMRKKGRRQQCVVICACVEWPLYSHCWMFRFCVAFLLNILIFGSSLTEVHFFLPSNAPIYCLLQFFVLFCSIWISTCETKRWKCKQMEWTMSMQHVSTRDTIEKCTH